MFILDDINSANFALATSMLGYEGAIKGTKKDGPQKQVMYIVWLEDTLRNDFLPPI